MCDYSAEDVKSRKAVVGDRLITAPISEHTIGLVARADPDTAVCMLPGTRVTIAGIEDKLRTEIGLKDRVAIATFRQRNVPGARFYFRDGFAFDDANPDWFSSAGDKVVLMMELGIVEVMVESIPGVSDDPTAATENAITASTETVVDRELVDA